MNDKELAQRIVKLGESPLAGIGKVTLYEIEAQRAALPLAKAYIAALDEIERLRAEIVRMQSVADTAAEDRMVLTQEIFAKDLRIDELNAEVERLRSALVEDSEIERLRKLYLNLELKCYDLNGQTAKLEVENRMLQETIRAKDAELERLRSFVCDKCSGSGYSGVIVGRACPKCHGTGRPKGGNDVE